MYVREDKLDCDFVYGRIKSCLAHSRTYENPELRVKMLDKAAKYSTIYLALIENMRDSHG